MSRTRRLDDTLKDDGKPPSVTLPAALVTAALSSRYAELGVLGEGGMGKVHLCRDERIGREVAMKVILPELQAKASSRARFVREATVQGQLEHPSIVPVHDLGATPEGATFFTMKRVRGSTLETVLAELATGVASSLERFSPRRLLGAFVNVCLAVDFAHSRGVVHRDLKPSNLMLGDFGEVYLLDWGIAKLADDAPESESVVGDELEVGQTPVPKTADGALLGTLAYMAPEQILGQPASVRSDVFALGAVLFEILAGMPLRPEGATFVSMAKGNHDARFSVRCPERNVAPELEAICVHATATEIGERFASARLLAEAVERFLEGDRDILLRRELAAAHVTTARDLLAHPSATPDGAGAAGVMRELGSALALDPENVEARTMVVAALTAVPSELPPEVKDALERRAQESVVVAARMWPAMLVTWIAFAPLLYLAGIRDFRALSCGLGLMAVATVFGLLRARRASGSGLEYAAFVFAALAMVVVGRPFGPFILVPTLLATFGTALQLHPRRRGRLVALGIVVIAIAGAVLFELSGVLPSGGEVSAATLLVATSTADRNVPLTLLILLMNVGATIMTAFTVSDVRARLTKAEERLLLHSWQVEGMMPPSVADRSSQRRLPVSRSARGAER